MNDKVSYSVKRKQSKMYEFNCQIKKKYKNFLHFIDMTIPMSTYKKHRWISFQIIQVSPFG